MYVSRARLRDVKCFRDVELRFQSAAMGTRDRQSNWNVILGENGDGKTTLLQGIAACLMDAKTADRTIKPTHWLRRGAKIAGLEATIVPEQGDLSVGRPQKDRPEDRIVQYMILPPGGGPSHSYLATAEIAEARPEYGPLFDGGYDRFATDIEFLKRNAFERKEKKGWFSAGYGPFRRLSGFSSTTVTVDDPLEKRFLTLFEEGAALFDCEGWLKELDRKGRKGAAWRAVFEESKEIVTKLLPQIDEIRVEEEVRFLWRGEETSLGHLSDGYRSMFALAVDVLRWLELSRADPKVPLDECRGVVLIDEIDAHLHPKWQRQAGFLLCETFPNLQFIVTSHSPFVAMAAGEGALTLLEREEDVVGARQDLPYVRGWAVDHVLSQLFGLVSLRDPETESKLERYEDLRIKHRRHHLKGDETRELADLETYLGERLRGEPDSPKHRQLDEDLALLAQARKEHEGT